MPRQSIKLGNRFKKPRLHIYVFGITRESLVDQELFSLPEHLSSPSVLVGFMLLDLLSFCSFSLAILLSVRLRFTSSNFPFGIFILFCIMIFKTTSHPYGELHIRQTQLTPIQFGELYPAGYT